MRMLCFFLFFSVMYIACDRKSKKKQDKKAADTTVAATANSNQITAYKHFVDGLDTTEVANISVATREYERLFSKADVVKGDSGFILFSSFYNRVTSYANEQHLKDPAVYDAYVSNDSPAADAERSPQADDYVKKLKENGLAIGMSEGNTYIKQERSFIARHFYPYVSKAMKEYLVQVNKENEEGFIEDAGLLVEPQELGRRLLFWESFLKKYPMFQYKEEITELQKGYLTFLLEGIDNSPLMKRSSNKIEKNYQDAFEYVIRSEPLSKTAVLIKPYYEALQRKDTKFAAKLLRQYKRSGIIYDYSA